MPFTKEEEMFDVSYLLDSIDSITEAIEAHFDSVSRSLKDTFRSSPWLPDSIKPRPPPSPPRRFPSMPVSYYEASLDWLSEHRAASAAVIAFIGTGAFIVWRRRRADRAKRRAKRAKNGARTEVVVLAGSVHAPLTRSLSQELERRGFIVYVQVNSLSEEQLVQSESRADIRPLNLDITSPSSTEEAIGKFANHISAPQKPITNAPPHTLHLAAIIVAPGTSLPTQPIGSLPPSIWSDTLNTRLLAPFTTVQAFLPLLISQKSTLLFLTPSIVPSLTPAYHAADSVVAGGLQQYISTLRKEVQGQGLNVVQFQLGHFDYGLSAPENHQQLVLSQQMSRSQATKRRSEEKGFSPRDITGTSLKELHNNIFDAIARGKGRNGTVFVGQGARMYGLIGKLVPDGIVNWMINARKQKQAASPTPDREGSPEGSSSAEWEKVAERDDDDAAYVYPKRR